MRHCAQPVTSKCDGSSKVQCVLAPVYGKRRSSHFTCEHNWGKCSSGDIVNGQPSNFSGSTQIHLHLVCRLCLVELLIETSLSVCKRFRSLRGSCTSIQAAFDNPMSRLGSQYSNIFEGRQGIPVQQEGILHTCTSEAQIPGRNDQTRASHKRSALPEALKETVRSC